MRLVQAREDPAWARSLGEAERRTDDSASRRRAACASEVDNGIRQSYAPATLYPGQMMKAGPSQDLFCRNLNPSLPSGMWPLGNDALKVAVEPLQSLTGTALWAIGIVMNASFRHVCRSE